MQWQPGKASHKTISQGEYNLLLEDIITEIEISEMPYSITDKHVIDFSIGGCAYRQLIIDVKKKAV